MTEENKEESKVESVVVEKRKVGAPKGSCLGHAPYPGCEKGGNKTVYTDAFIEREAEALLEWMKKTDSIYFKQFAQSRGYHWNKCLDWAKKNERFNDVYLVLKDWQECKLAVGGLTKLYDGSFTKFLMLNICGMKEEKQINVKSTGPIAEWITEASGKSKGLLNNND